MTEDQIKPVPNLKQALENILQVLNVDPKHYRNFGARWWAVKAMLKRHGFDATRFYGLGDFVDEEAAAEVDPGPDAFVLAWALDEYGHNARLNLGSPDVYLPDGTPYHLFDPDVNL